MASLVDEIRAQALDGRVPVTALLLKVKVAAAELELPEFEAWADRELDGYPADSEIPRYRMVAAELRAWNPYQGWQAILSSDPKTLKLFNRTVPILQPIGQLEELSRARDGTLQAAPSAEMKAHILRSLEFPTEISWFIDRGRVFGIVDALRKQILDWSIRLKKAGIKGEELSFSEPEKQRAHERDIYNFNFTNSQVSAGAIGRLADQASGNSAQTVTAGLDVRAVAVLVTTIATANRANQFGIPEAGQQALQSEILVVEKELQSSTPQAPLVKRALQTMQEILKTSAMNAVGQLAVQGALNGIEMLLRHL